MDILLIENAFKKICDEKSEYGEYYHVYFATKYILQKHYYPFIKDVNPFYTDHGIDHVNRLLNRIYSLLDNHLVINMETTPYSSTDVRGQKGSKLLTAYELYLLMCSVLWHDIGNLYCREGHADNIEMFYDQARNFLHDKTTSEWVEKIAAAHSGSGAIEVKIDTDIKYAKGFPYHPRFLAALLRFADELDEDQDRIGERMYDIIPAQHIGCEAYWFFCKCNESIHIEEEGDFGARKIVVESKIIKSDLFRELSKETGGGGIEKVIGIEEYCKRIDKINKERQYCASYLDKAHYFSTPQKIELRLSIYDTDSKTFLEKINYTYDNTHGTVDFFTKNKSILDKYRG